MKKFAVFDIDGTLIRWQLYHAIADQLVKQGHIDPADFDAIKDARQAWKYRQHAESFKAYEQKLVSLYNQSLTNLSLVHFNQAANVVFEEYKDQVYTYTRDLIKQLKTDGYLLFAISGSQTEIVKMIAEHYSFDDFVGTEFIANNGFFTGEVHAALGKKHQVLAKMVKKHGATTKGSIAVGDSAGDITMLEVVENPVAFNPERSLFDHAKNKGWKIVVERKNMVYELEARSGKYILV